MLLRSSRRALLQTAVDYPHQAASESAVTEAAMARRGTRRDLAESARRPTEQRIRAAHLGSIPQEAIPGETRARAGVRRAAPR